MLMRSVTKYRVDTGWAAVIVALAACLAIAETTAVAEAPVAAPPSDAPKPGPNDRQIALAVRSYLEREHFLRYPGDDEIAHRWFDVFLETLDPLKLYLLESDIDAFGQHRDMLDDLVKRGDVTFAYGVFARFLQRVDARMPLIEKLLDTPHDFTTGESLVIDRKQTKWAATEAEAEDSWRKRIKYDLLVQKMEKTPPEEAKEKLLRRYRSFAKRMHQMKSDELLETYLSALAGSINPHTTFMSPGTLENFEIGMRLQQYDDVDPGTAWDGPLVVVTNKLSASASEIVAGAIQDYRRGLVIGDHTTHGKGTVQTPIDLGQQLFRRMPNAPALGAIKITIQQFYRPGGASTQLEGVKSDVELPSITTHLPVGESDLDHAIAFDKVPPAELDSSGRVTAAMLTALRERSAARVASNKEFEKIGKDIAQYKKRKEDKTISLVESEFSRRWNEGKAADDEEKMIEEGEQRRLVVKRDFYFDEAMNVAIDYLQALAGGANILAGTPASGQPRPVSVTP